MRQQGLARGGLPRSACCPKDVPDETKQYQARITDFGRTSPRQASPSLSTDPQRLRCLRLASGVNQRSNTDALGFFRDVPPGVNDQLGSQWRGAIPEPDQYRRHWNGYPSKRAPHDSGRIAGNHLMRRFE